MGVSADGQTAAGASLNNNVLMDVSALANSYRSTISGLVNDDQYLHSASCQFVRFFESPEDDPRQ